MDKEIRELLAGYVDCELNEADRMRVESAMTDDPSIVEEVREFRKLKEVTGMAVYADLPDEVWEKYWESLYKKLERGIGWLLFSLGAMILLGFGLFEALQQLYQDPTVPLWLKIGTTALTGGGLILLISIVRERLFARKRERYTQVQK